MEKRYWIQEQAPDGGYFNSVGLDLATTVESAKAQIDNWRREIPGHKVRLALIITIPIE